MKYRMSFVCLGEENTDCNKTLFTVEGISFLHVLGLIDAEIVKLYGSELLDNEPSGEIAAVLEAHEAGLTEHKRKDFSTPESDWLLKWETFE